MRIPGRMVGWETNSTHAPNIESAPTVARKTLRNTHTGTVSSDMHKLLINVWTQRAASRIQEASKRLTLLHEPFRRG
jgi:hypothetical protein